MKHLKTSYYEGTGTPQLYRKGWRELINNGFHRQTKDTRHDAQPDCHHIVAKLNGRQVGVISFIVNVATIVDEALVQMIYVKPDYRRHGVATKLHEALEQWCKDNSVSVIEYSTNSNNWNAQFFHTAKGARETFVHYEYKVKS